MSREKKTIIETTTINIPECPVCGQAHKYNLNIHRTMVMYSGNEDKQGKRFMRLFICPTKGEEFEAEFSVKETAIARIEQIDLA